MADPLIATYIDTLRDLLPVPTGWQKDDTLTGPVRALPNTLYLFPIRLAPQRLEGDDALGMGVGMARWPEAFLNVRCVLSAAAKGEQRVKSMERATSLILDAAVAALIIAVAANRRDDYGLWWDLYVSNIAFDASRSPDTRQHYVDMMIRAVPPAALS